MSGRKLHLCNIHQKELTVRKIVRILLQITHLFTQYSVVVWWLCVRKTWWMIDYHFIKVIFSICNASQSHCQMSLEAPHTLCSDSNLSHGTGMLAVVIHSPLTQETSIKGCLLVFTLFIHGLSPLRSRLFFRPSSYNRWISFISAQGAVVIKFQYTSHILGC